MTSLPSAGVNAPALQYYFDNKEGVYLACAEQIVARVWEHLSEEVNSAERPLASDADDDTLIRAMALSGQQLYFQVMRRTVLSILNWDVINPDRLASLKRVIGEQTAALLRSMAATRDTAAPPAD